MKNKMLIVILLFFILFIIVGGYIYTIKQDNKTKEIKVEEKKIVKKLNPQEEKKIKKETEIKNRIAKFKKNVTSKGLIVAGDIQLKNDEYLFALQKFLKANKETPNNPRVISKIADTYFLMKNYDLAYKYYSRITDTDFLDKNNKTLSYIYNQNLENKIFIRNSSGSLNNSGSLIIDNIKKEIETFNLDSDNEFYYLNSLDCIKDFHSCKQHFQNYFKNTNYSGSNQNLENIRNAINNYENLKVDEIYYKNALIIGSFLNNRNYPISIILSKELLKEQKNYKPIIKILAQSYFELNKLELANKYLLEHAKIDSNSPDVSYMLGIIAQKNHDYIKSNIFLKLATEQNYKHLENIYRLELYNYLILDNTDKILEIFDKIIKLNKKPNFNDLMLATYYNILNNNLDKSLKYSELGIKLYSESEDFYGFKAWIFIEKGKLDEATELLNKAKKINPRNALIVLNLGRISKIKYEKSGGTFDKIKAKFLFKKTIELDTAEIGELAKKYLKQLDEEKEKNVE